MAEWTDELRAQVVEMYTARNPTPENSMEIAKEIAEEVNQSPNGVRMILSKANVYVVKTPATKTASSSGDSEGKSTRVSKESSHARLTEALNAKGSNANAEIISKLTGKAALYFAEVLEAL